MFKKYMKDKTTAILLCFFLGAFGAHKYYLGQTGAAIAYTLFFWTLIPGLIAFIDFIILICMNEQEFNFKYNQRYGNVNNFQVNFHPGANPGYQGQGQANHNFIPQGQQPMITNHSLNTIQAGNRTLSENMSDTTNNASVKHSVVGAIEDLYELHKVGAISASEYEEKKANLLNKM
jgi:TM2 domain-containing membrane protein YozV